MSIKDWLHRYQPVQLYIILTLSICFCIVQIILSHLTHALTLQFAAYHMLCNIIALIGSVFTVKLSKKTLTRQKDGSNLSMADSNSIKNQINNCDIISSDPSKDEKNGFMKCSTTIPIPQTDRDRHEQKLRNTFGWVRIDCLTMSICFIFLASFSISNAIEAVKMFLHMDHKHTAHFPILILICGTIGLILNAFTYLLIGGYTMHQGSFINVTPPKDLPSETNSSIKSENDLNTSTLSREDINNEIDHNCSRRQGFVECIRDISSFVFVIICGGIIYFTDSQVEMLKYVDPITSLISCTVLVVMSYPYVHKSCLVLLQTIPGTIDIKIFKDSLLTNFNEIVSVHDLHIWSLTTSKYVSTAHIIFKNPQAYLQIMMDVERYFKEQGITIVTIQPEFENTNLILPKECLVSCKNLTCIDKTCCQSLLINETNCNHKNNKSKQPKKHCWTMSVRSLHEIERDHTKSHLPQNINALKNRTNIQNDSQISTTISTASASAILDPDNTTSRDNDQTTNTTNLTTSSSSCPNIQEQTQNADKLVGSTAVTA